MQIANYIPSYEDLDYPAKLEGSPNTTSDTNLGVKYQFSDYFHDLVIFSCILTFCGAG